MGEEIRLQMLAGRKTAIYGKDERATAWADGLIQKGDALCAISLAEPYGGTFRGLPILSLEAALKAGAKAVVVCPEPNRSERVFEKILPLCAAQEVEVFDGLGQSVSAGAKRLESCVYQDGEGWRALAEGYDVVSLSVMDTVLNRDVFCDRILYPRWPLSELITFCKGSGREVVLMGSIRFSHVCQIQALAECPAYADPQELKTDLVFTDRDEACFRRLAQRFSGKRILHIGYRLYSDGILPRAFGIDTYRMNYKLGRISIDEGKIPAVSKVEYLRMLQSLSSQGECRARALCESALFPEAGPAPETIPEGQQARLFGYAVMGPILCGYLQWFKRAVQEEGCERALFVSRDGWLVKELYDRYLAKETNVPSIYFYTSRRSAFLTVMEDFSPGYIAGSAEGLSPEEMMRRYYGLSGEDILPWREGAFTDRSDYIRQHARAIRARSRQARRNTLLYFRRAELRIGDRYALSDFVAAGTCQTMLTRFAPFELRGLYFGTAGADRGFSTGIRSYFGRSNREILRRYINLEYYMTSPEPSLESYDEEGRPVLGRDGRSRAAMERIQVVQDGIRAFAADWYGAADASKEEISAEAAEALCLAGIFLQPKEKLVDDWSGQTLAQ